VKSHGLKIDLLVNNAGLGVFENFLDTPLKPQMEQVDVNVRALVSLTHAFTPGMVTGKRGGIINMASTAGFQPLASADVYCDEGFRTALQRGSFVRTGEERGARACVLPRSGCYAVLYPHGP
jgi:NADP-dependent 3-hydroxy acid dehydrogenase YdfG